MSVAAPLRRSPLPGLAETSAPARSQATELLRLLEFELSYLENGGYNRSWRPRWLLIDSPVCPYQGEPQPPGSCLRCPLMALAPPGPYPQGICCHQIVISPDGGTIDSITRLGDQHRLEQAYRTWLLQQIQELRRQASAAVRAEPKGLVA